MRPSDSRRDGHPADRRDSGHGDGGDGPARGDGERRRSLSLEPMLMLACLDRGSRTLLAVQAANCFGVNVLSADQA